MQEEFSRIAQYARQANKLPVVFEAFPSPMATAVGVTILLLPVTIVFDVESVGSNISKRDIVVAKSLPGSCHSLNKTVAVSVHNSEHGSTTARSSKKRFLATVTATATEIVKRKDALDATNAAESSRLSPRAVAMQDTLLDAMRTVCCVYTEDFQSLYETHRAPG